LISGEKLAKMRMCNSTQQETTDAGVSGKITLKQVRDR